MITTYIPNNFIPERTYAVHTLLRHYLGLEVEIVARPKQVHYEIVWEDKSIVVKDEFFGHTIVGQHYLAEDRIPERIIESKKLGAHHVLILFGKDEFEFSENKITCGVDLFAGAFFMLTRWEESLGLYEDLHGRFPAEKSLVVKSGFILRPVVDEYVALLKFWLKELGFPVREKKEEFKIVPTCDVDMPFYWLKKPRWKVIVSEWLKEKKMATITESLQNIRGIEKGWLRDPHDQFDYMMTCAENAGLRFQFNMLVGGMSKFEGYYSIKDPLIKKLMESFKNRGHHIGLHPSYNSFMDARLLREEKKLLEKHTGDVVTTSRQHYLRFSVPRTWNILDNEGIKEDSTLGYAAEPGFRCGTSKPFPVFDINEQRMLSLMEHPLLIMDVTFRNYKKTSPEESIAICDQIKKEVKKHNGEFVFLWHNSNLSEVDSWNDWKVVFENLFHSS